MFVPKFGEGTGSISYDLAEIERIIFRVEKIVIMPKYESWLQREAFIRTAYSSTMVENATIPEQEMEDIAKLAPVAIIPENRPDVANYAKALEFIDFIDDSEIVVEEAVIRQIHWQLMKGIKDTSLKPGQYRTEPNWIELGGVKVYDPPFHVEVPILMREFHEWLLADEKINPIIKAGIAHAHLIAIHPFMDGNGRTARLLAILLLRKYGYGFRKLLSLDGYYQRSRDEYIGALQRSFGQKFASGYDFTPWLEFFTRSVLIQAGWLEQNLTDWRMFIDKAHSDFKPFGLSDRQIDGLMYAFRVGHITRKDYMEITKISPLTATRDLADLVKRNFLTPKGAGRNRIYISKQLKTTEVGEGQQQQLL